MCEFHLKALETKLSQMRKQSNLSAYCHNDYRFYESHGFLIVGLHTQLTTKTFLPTLKRTRFTDLHSHTSITYRPHRFPSQTCKRRHNNHVQRPSRPLLRTHKSKRAASHRRRRSLALRMRQTCRIASICSNKALLNVKFGSKYRK